MSVIAKIMLLMIDIT